MSDSEVDDVLDRARCTPWVVLLAAFTLLSLPAACAARGGAVIDEFEMAPCLDMITVPVTCSGEVFEFLLDTGASSCLVDKSLAHLLGEPVGRAYAQTPTGVEAIELYLPLQASVGELALNPDEPMACVDLSGFEHATGRDIRGVIGMSFMRRFGLQLDFDDGIVRFIESPLSDDSMLGQELELELEPKATPKLTATIIDTAEWTFTLDTGCGPTGSVNHRTCEALLALEVLHPIGLTRGGALMRDFTASAAVLDSLVLGPFTHRGLMLSRTESSVVGIPFLAQYNITFGFPERRVWFRPSERYGVAPGLNLSGLSLMSLGGQCVVADMHSGGPASEIGLEQGDVLVSVGGVPVGGLSLACIDAALCEAMGDTIEIVASRNGSEHSGVLDLRWVERSERADEPDEPPN